VSLGDDKYLGGVRKYWYSSIKEISLTVRLLESKIWDRPLNKKKKIRKRKNKKKEKIKEKNKKEKFSSFLSIILRNFSPCQQGARYIAGSITGIKFWMLKTVYVKLVHRSGKSSEVRKNSPLIYMYIY
jgi:hypothetical protein